MKNFFTISVAVLLASSTQVLAQTNVYDDIIATSPDHTTLAAALTQTGLDSVLQNPMADFTVFAPDDDAFDDLAAELGVVNTSDLLNLPNLDSILLYHVLGSTVGSSMINNGDIVTPVNDENTIKLTLTSGAELFANQAEVYAGDLPADNGVVHVLDAVLLPDETVADVAIDNNFGILVDAVVAAELLPALTDPFADFTVFAPSDAAFTALLAELNITAADLLADPDLDEILAYHVLDMSVPSDSISNGDIVNALNTDNTLKLTVTSMGDVFVNQAQVELADVFADNGVVHAIDEVVLADETVVDVALDNGFSTLATAVVTAELLPALTDPFEEYTVFAPDNDAFNDLAAELNLDLNGILALPNLGDILLYHVVDGTVLSSQLSNGPVPTLSGANVIINTDMGVMVNTATVTTPDLTVDNGVVHAIDKVLQENANGLNDVRFEALSFYPNPIQNEIRLENISAEAEYTIYAIDGRLVKSGFVNGTTIDVSALQAGSYMISVEDANTIAQGSMIKL